MILDIAGKSTYDTSFEMNLMQSSISYYRDAKLRYSGSENYESQVLFI